MKYAIIQGYHSSRWPNVKYSSEESCVIHFAEAATAIDALVSINPLLLSYYVQHARNYKELVKYISMTTGAKLDGYLEEYRKEKKVEPFPPQEGLATAMMFSALTDDVFIIYPTK